MNSCETLAPSVTTGTVSDRRHVTGTVSDRHWHRQRQSLAPSETVTVHVSPITVDDVTDRKLKRMAPAARRWAEGPSPSHDHEPDCRYGHDLLWQVEGLGAGAWPAQGDDYHRAGIMIMIIGYKDA
jgi:hypothetical protein